MVWFCDKHQMHSCDDVCWKCDDAHQSLAVMREERDAARREAEELKARVQKLEAFIEESAYDDGPNAEEQVRARRERARALLAPPPERAGEEGRG